MTGLRIVVAKRALAEIEAAATTLDALRPGHGMAFRCEVDAIFDAITQYPRLYQRVSRHDAIRRAVLHRFAFIVVYHLGDNDITVLAVLPSRMKPKPVTLK
jgi:plasmid stabilization system protein ParE